jgi:hypothetical protein
MEGVRTEQDAIRCPACGGQSVFHRIADALVCQSCGTARDLADPHRDRDARRETPYDPTRDDDTPTAEPHVIDGTHLHACTACGGQIVFIGHALSENCPYCNGAVVRGPEETSYETMGLIPFRLPQDRALGRARDWIARRLAAPGGPVAGGVGGADGRPLRALLDLRQRRGDHLLGALQGNGRARTPACAT